MRRKLTARPNFCFYCGKKIKFAGATKDHVRPISKGGSKHTNNLVWACFDCNQDKGNLLLEEYRVVLAFRKGYLWTNYPFPGEIKRKIRY